ncbi:MAG: hypothetical protein RL277_729 [Planctomycetota bacterium]
MNLSRTQALIVLGLLALAAAWLRVSLTLADPGFDPVEARGLLRSDPALLFHFVQSILDAGGWPSEFASHARIEAPVPMSVPALFALGPEFGIAGFHALLQGTLAPDLPLHVSCLWFSSLCASGLVFGAALLARELGLSRALALLAALLTLLLPANQRTLGFLLVGEDYSFPLWLLHLGLALRAVRTRSSVWALLASFSLLVSLATWHAASFFLTLEVAGGFALYLRSAGNPLRERPGQLALGVLLLGSLAIPMLRHTAFVFSLPAAVLLGMAAGRTRVAACACAGLVLSAGLAWAHLSGSGSGEYSHVFALLAAKLGHALALPADPRELPFEVRIMWQGPFASLGPATLLTMLGVGSLAALSSARMLGRFFSQPAASDPRAALVAGLFWLGLPLALMIERVVILPGALAGVLLVHALTRKRAWLFGLTALQLALFSAHYREWRNPWYQPVIRRDELRAALAAVERLTPSGAVVATDFVNGPAVLAHTGRAIVQQPKWETRRSRERIEEFLKAWFEGDLVSFHRLLQERYGAGYLLVDRATLTMGMRYAAGVPPGVPLRPDSPAALLGSFDGRPTPPVNGFEVLYESSPLLRQSNGQPSALFRLYKLK